MYEVILAACFEWPLSLKTMELMSTMKPMSMLLFSLEHQSPALAAEKYCRAALRISLDRNMSVRIIGRDASTDFTVQRMFCCFKILLSRLGLLLLMHHQHS